MELDTATPPTGKVSLVAAGGFTLKGSVQPGRSGVDMMGRAHVCLVGGAGGLGTLVNPAAYENAQLGDPLRAVIAAAGETLSSTVSSSITSLILPKWTIVRQRAADLLDLLAQVASQRLGQLVTWRVLSDGTVWLGVETWPATAMPAGSDIINQYPAQSRFEIGAATPSILPGINLAGVGHVAAVDHWIRPDQVRSDVWIWGPVDAFRAAVRAAVGMSNVPGEAPDLMRLGLYRATVTACASDGSTLDVTPTDARISPEKNVRFLVGIPGAVMTVQPGGVVHLGWERGDPLLPYCVPAWESGATVTKLVLAAQSLFLGAEAGALALATKTDIENIRLAIAGAAVVAMDGGAAFKTNIALGWPAAVGTTLVKGK